MREHDERQLEADRERGRALGAADRDPDLRADHLAILKRLQATSALHVARTRSGTAILRELLCKGYQLASLCLAYMDEAKYLPAEVVIRSLVHEGAAGSFMADNVAPCKVVCVLERRGP